MTPAGLLVVVATPIGNLGDLSPRARQALSEADLLCCEDTRRTRQLLSHAGITGKRLLSVHGHNEAARVEEVLGHLRRGETVAVVSDAGTPAVSDPGARLVAAAVLAEAAVTAVPGPNAALTALVVSGLPTDRFCFEGFLPRRGAERRRRVAAVAQATQTVLLHETAPRLAATLAELSDACGAGRRVVVARELTKLHEELWRGTLGQGAAHFAQREVRGEIVVVLEPAPRLPPQADDDTVADAVRRRVAAGDSAREAAASVAEELGVSRRRAYEVAAAARRNAGDRAPVVRGTAPPEEDP